MPRAKKSPAPACRPGEAPVGSLGRARSNCQILFVGCYTQDNRSHQPGRSSLPRSARNMASCCQARRYFFDTARRCSSGRMVLLASTGLPFLAAVRCFALPHQPIRSRLYILCTISDIMPAPGIPMAICIVFLCPAAMLCRHIFFPRCAKLFHFRAPFLLVVVPFL